ncbi:2OG-Fe(II) oxygenase family protein [Streptomyces adustus]|uniref:2OG-Fe(II) oxygenase family protein n=1 Tax=Streptomyces adustus TaxID=1609272 RepID=UPI0035D65B21
MTHLPQPSNAPPAHGLPAVPGEQEALARCPTVDLERARTEAGRLVFDRGDAGLGRALELGFFLVEIPRQADVAVGDLLAREFHRPAQGDGLDGYRGYQGIEAPSRYEGYLDRADAQWENLYLEMTHWPMLPSAVARLGRHMGDLGTSVLRSVLGHVGVPEEQWSEVTGGLSDGGGHRMLAFNHFRSDRKLRGAKFHRDSGWVTVLRATEPGLLAHIDGQMMNVAPQPGYFIVNFGSSIEVLTEFLDRPVKAVVHGVVRTERPAAAPNRTSYLLFLDSSLESTIYRYEDGVARALGRRGDARAAARALLRPVGGR